MKAHKVAKMLLLPFCQLMAIAVLFALPACSPESSPPTDVLPNAGWVSNTAKIKSLAKGSATSPARFQINLEKSPGYIQSSPGAFRQLAAGQGKPIPAGSKTVSVEVNLTAKPPGPVRLFFLVYDSKGARLKTETHRSLELPPTGPANLTVPFPLPPDAARYIVALRFAEYNGEAAINSCKVTFSGAK